MRVGVKLLLVAAAVTAAGVLIGFCVSHLTTLAGSPAYSVPVQNVNGHPVVNGVEQSDEPFIIPCGNAGACNLPKPITIPADHYFMMGDNRGASDDSRFCALHAHAVRLQRLLHGPGRKRHSGNGPTAHWSLLSTPRTGPLRYGG